MRISTHILNGVESVPKLGIPGTIAVFGHNAEGVLTGTGASDVLIAATVSGKGKVVVFPQDAYPTQFHLWATSSPKRNKELDRLNGNIARWMLGNDCHSVRQTDVVRVDEIKKLESAAEKVKILVWAGSGLANPLLEPWIKASVESGKGLVVGCTPWGFLQSRPNKTLWDLPLNSFLLEYGFAFSPHYIQGESFQVSSNKSHMSNIRHCLKVCDFGSDMTHNFDIFTKALPNCPPCVLTEMAEELETIYEANRKKVHHIPTPESPIKRPNEKALMAVCEIVHRYGLRSGQPLPGVDSFPGNFNASPPTETISLEIHAPRLDYYATGFYAPAAQPVFVEVLSDIDPEKVWIMMVGCHTDNIYDCTRYKRWPILNERVLVTEKEMQVFSALGGSIYFLSPRSTSIQTLKIRMKNVVESPYIDLTDPKSVSDWSRRKQSPGLWADMCGEFITFTLPSTNVRDLDDPVPALQLWDQIITSHHELKGSSIRRSRRQWIVFDVQPRLGLMHAGYPIVATIEHALKARASEIKEFALDYNHIKMNGSWALFHETGHNMQEHVWTFEGTTEVTVNIFTLHAMEVICGKPHWIHSWLETQLASIAKYLNTSCKFSDWKSQHGVGLSVYVQLIHHFGWASMKCVLRVYEGMRRGDKPRDNQEKIDQWVINYSNVVKLDLCPLFDFWAIPITTPAREKLSSLTPFLPNDEFTRLCLSREQMVLKRYTNVTRNGIVKSDTYEYAIEPPFVVFPYVRKG